MDEHFLMESKWENLGPKVNAHEKASLVEKAFNKQIDKVTFLMCVSQPLSTHCDF